MRSHTFMAMTVCLMLASIASATMVHQDWNTGVAGSRDAIKEFLSGGKPAAEVTAADPAPGTDSPGRPCSDAHPTLFLSCATPFRCDRTLPCL